jgi:hypothetical protein
MEYECDSQPTNSMGKSASRSTTVGGILQRQENDSPE